MYLDTTVQFSVAISYFIFFMYFIYKPDVFHQEFDC